MSTTTQRPASEKQQVLIEKLLAEKDLAGTSYEGWTPDWSRATLASASAVIEFLFTLPRKATVAASTPAVEPEAGIYQSGDDLFRVYLGQQSGKMLVKRVTFHVYDPDGADHELGSLNDFNGELAAAAAEARLVTSVTYEYVGAAAKVLPADAVRLTVEQVGALGKSWDHCLCCGRRLDDPESVDRGIGPVCAAKYA